MLTESSSLIKFVLSILMFPLLFQNEFIGFAWAADDVFWMMVLKRLFLLLPVLAFILAVWVSILAFISIIIRHNRRQFFISIIVTWWDLGKSVIAFWGGIFRFIFHLFASLIGLLKIMVLAIWSLVQEILFLPFRLFRNVGRSVVSSPVPWIAVILTILWCLIEAVIFTYVMTPIVIDTFSNITGEQLNEYFIRIPLFIFLLFIVLGSYAVLATMIDAVKQKNISAIIGIGVIEIVTLFVEVVFLYREFVDSLVPWFAQYSENFELGVFWTLAISCFVWFGIRSLSWFLFASHGTPTLLSVIQGKGIVLAKRNGSQRQAAPAAAPNFVAQIKQDANWVTAKGEELLAAFMLPPLQVIAAGINFCTLLITSGHLFNLPFKKIEDITDSKLLMEKYAEKSESLKKA